MRSPLPFVLSGAIWLAVIIAAATVGPKPQEDRPADYWGCRSLHPERYCRLQHLQATVAQEQDGSR